MVRLVSIFLLFYLFACNTNQNKKKGYTTDLEWVTFDSTTKTHFYNSKGIIDSTIELRHYLMNNKGETGMVVKSLIKRAYNSYDSLISEIEFLILENGDRELSSERLLKYDSKNNLIFEMYSLEGETTFSNKYEYYQNRRNKKIHIFIDPKSLSRAVRSDKEKSSVKYDTIVTVYKYDNNGIQIFPRDSKETYPFTDTIDKYKIFYKNQYKNVDTLILYSVNKRLSDNFILSTDTTWEVNGNPVKWVDNNFETKQFRMGIIKYDSRGNEVLEVTYNGH